MSTSGVLPIVTADHHENLTGLIGLGVGDHLSLIPTTRGMTPTVCLEMVLVLRGLAPNCIPIAQT